MWTSTSFWVPQNDPVHPIWKLCELYDPSHSTIGILHKTANSAWLSQQMANRLFDCFVRLFFIIIILLLLFFVLFCSKTNTFLQIIFPLKWCG